MARLRALAIGILFVLGLPGCSDADRQENTDQNAESARPPGAAESLGGSGGSGLAVPAAQPLEPVVEEPPPTPEEVAALRAAIEADPDDHARVRALAVALYRLKQRDEVLELFQAAAERSPGVTTYLDLALAYSNQGFWPEAERIYEKLLAIDPDHAIATHNLGIIAFNRGDTDRAVAQYQRALELDPGYLLAHASLANALKRQGLYREAYAMYGRVIDLEPTSPAELVVFDDALYNMASLDITMGAYARAAEMLQELLLHDPEHPKAHYALGQALLQLGQPDEAQAHFSTHMQIIARTKTDSAVATGN